MIPLKDVAVTVTDTSGAAIAMRLTNRSGKLDELIEISVPDLAASQSPNTGIIPFTTVNLYAKAEDYEEITLRRDGSDLLLNTGENTLWLSFRKCSR